MTISLRRLGAPDDPAEPGHPQTVRHWLSTAIAAAAVPGCRACGTARPCPPHAADAVLNACRQEQLFIMPAAEADAIIAAARDDHAAR
jgi:hypothetical protein